MARSTNDRIQYGGLPVWHHTLHGTAHDFIAKGTNQIGYVWYADGVGGTGYADMGRTGTSALAHYLYPTGDEAFRAFAKLNAECIGNHPDTFIDTHGCPLLGMVWTALGAATDPPSFRNGMRADREADPQRRPAGAHHQARSSMSVPPFQVATNH